MKLHRIVLENFRGVRHREVDFPATGVTVLVGRNESGKSSVIEAFDLLLEVIPTSTSKKTVHPARTQGHDVPLAVQAEFTIGAHRLLYSKRWLKNAGAELTYLAGPMTGQTATGRTAHDAVRDLLEASDLTLWNALRLLQTGRPSDDFAGSSALRQALEADGGQIGDDSAQTTVLAAARAERAKYFTDRGEARRGANTVQVRYDDALAQHANARERLDEITVAVEAYDRAFSEARHAKSTVASATVALQEAQRAAADVESLKQQREAARVAVEDADATAQRAQEDQRSRHELITRVAESAERIARAQAELAVALEESGRRGEVADDARSALTQAREHEQLTRQGEREARDREQRFNDSRKLAELSSLVEQLDALDRETGTLAEHTPSGVTAAELEALEQAQRDVEVAEIQFRAGSAQLTVTGVAESTDLTVDEQPTQLTAAESLQRPVTETVTVEIPGHIRVVVEPEGGLAQRQDQVRKAQDVLAKNLADTGMESVPAAREALHRDQEMQRLASELAQRRHLMLQRRDESALRQEHRDLTARLGHDLTARRSHGDSVANTGAAQPTSPTSPSSPAPPAEVTADADPADTPVPDAPELRQAVQQAADLAETARERVLRCEQSLAQADAALTQTRTAHAQAAAQVAAQERAHADQLEQLDTARNRHTDDSLAAAVVSAAEQLRAATSRLEAANAQWDASDAEQVLTLARGHQTRLDAAQQRWQAAQAARSRAEGILDGLDRGTRQREFDHAVTLLRSVARELTAHLKRAAAAKLLADTLEDHQAQAHRRYNAPFRRQLELLGKAVFGSTFQVELADDLTVTRRGLNGTWLEVSALSTGAQEQMDVLIRLAVATLVDPSQGVPVILDDTLVHSDPHRLISLASALESAGARAQVIVLTATPDRFSAVAGANIMRIEDL